MNDITRFSDVLAINELVMAWQKQGIIKISDNYLEVSNTLFLKIADEHLTYENEGIYYGGQIFWLHMKGHKLIVRTEVAGKDMPRFIANVRAKPSVFQKMLNWIIR